jgi:hypothetical protein
MSNQLTVQKAQETVNVVQGFFVNNNEFLRNLEEQISKHGLDNVSKKDLLSIIVEFSRLSHATFCAIDTELVSMVDFYTKFRPVIKG